MRTVLCVPQWQGSASERAEALRTGAHRAAELAGAEATVTVPVSELAGERRSGVRSLDALVENLRQTQAALSGLGDGVLTVGGDCGVDLAPITAARDRHPDLTVVWIDAHPDVYSPENLPSGAFHGMVVRTLLGDGPAELSPDRPLRPEQIVILGERAGAPVEHQYLAQKRVRRHGVAELEEVLTGLSGPLYIHIDLDVLEPTEFASTCYPEPDGIRAHRLTALLPRLEQVVGAAITEHAPGTTDPAEADILRRLAASLPL